jgi:proline dehydrogenase
VSLTGRILGGVVGYLPPSAIRKMAKQYAAGATVQDAMREIRSLSNAGLASTVSVLGEAASSVAYADSQIRELCSVLNETARVGDLDVRLGIKLTALGLDVSKELAQQNLLYLASQAGEVGCLLEVDMEQLPYVDQTLNAVHEAHKTHSNVTAVVQAYLHRSRADVRSLVDLGIPARIVKGTYKEGPLNAYQLPEVIRGNFLALVRSYFEAGVPVGVATHDEYLIYRVLDLVDELGVAKESYEFQMIMGIQEILRGTLVDAGHKVRVTVHFGSDLHKWSIRRLKENPEIARYAMQGMSERVRGRLAKPHGG